MTSHSSNLLLQALIEDAEIRLPNKMKEVLKGKISFVESNIKFNEILSAPSDNKCSDARNCQCKEPSTLTKNLYKIKKDSSFFVSRSDSNYTVILNEDLINAAQNPEPACRHKDSYWFAVGAILNAVAQIYDQTGLNQEDRTMQSICENKEQGDRSQAPCTSFLMRSHLISDSARFLALSSFEGVQGSQSTQIKEIVRDCDIHISMLEKRGQLEKLKQVKENCAKSETKKSIEPRVFVNYDLRELESPQESFASLFESFILDRDGKFRAYRPGSWFYLSEILNHTPNYEFEIPEESLKRIRHFPIITEYKKNETKAVELNPRRLFEVSIQVAGPGKLDFTDKFGHIQFLFVYCSPERETVDEKCREDKDHHIVGTFYADSTLQNSNSVWMGFSETWPSMMFLYALKDRENFYISDQNRALTTYPLNLTADELQLANGLAIEYQRTYRSKWHHLNRNCVVQTLRFLSAVTSRFKIERMVNVTPQGVLDELKMQKGLFK
jgi:hypothetical protein